MLAFDGMGVMQIRWHGEVAARFERTEVETLALAGIKVRGRLVWTEGPAATDLLTELKEADRRVEDAGIVEIDPPGPRVRAFLSLISPTTGEALLLTIAG
jgi:hypothetical protein